MSPAVHLVGSVPAPNAEAVFRLLAARLGDAAARFPDGETGPRYNWIRWQQAIFDAHPGFELAFVKQLVIERPYYALRADAKAADVRFGPLGYAASAIDSYEAFARLKNQGVIPKAVRFQVSLPTPAAVLNAFVGDRDRVAVEPAYEARMMEEAREIAAAVPASELAIQWDVCYEVLAHDGWYPCYYRDADIVEGSVRRLQRLVSAIPAEAQAGIHLCYGDLGHKHAIEPKDTSTCVRFINAFEAGLSRAIDWYHLPVPRDRTDDAYFAPLAGLKLRAGAELFLGLVHQTGGLDATATRISAARRHVASFGVATECGLARRDPSTIPGLLDQHVAAARLARSH